MIAVAVVYYKLPRALQESRTLLKKTFFVMACFFLYSVIQGFAFSDRMLVARDTTYHGFAIWFTFAVTFPPSLLLFPVSFLFSFYLAHKCVLCVKGLKHFCQCCAKGRRSVHFQQQQDYTAQNVPTVQASSRVSPPSSTFFHVPYTDEFTKVTSENAPLVSNESQNNIKFYGPGRQAP